jgi:hypothetical protein
MLFLQVMIFGCTAHFRTGSHVQEAELGYVKFYRSDKEKYEARFPVFRRKYGKETFVGNVDNNKDYLCIAVHSGINVFKIFAPGREESPELRIINVKEGKIHPVEIIVAWSEGRLFDAFSFFRWDVKVNQGARDPEDGECGLTVEKVVTPEDVTAPDAEEKKE